MSVILSQQQSIVKYLLKYPRRGITTFEAFEKLYITKLTTRISELRDMGYIFHVEKERTENATFNRYFLRKCPKGYDKKINCR